MEIKSKFDHFNINVTNLERSIAFYEKALGLKEHHRKESSDGSFTLVYLTDSSTAMQYGVSITGVYIMGVTGDNAKKAGLQQGDMIYYLDDVKITDSATLLKTIQSHKVGDTVTFTIVRGGDILKVDVQLEDSAKIQQKASANTKKDMSAQN